MADKQKRGFILTRPFSRWLSERRALHSGSSAAVSVRGVGSPDFGVRVDNNTALKNTAYYAGIRIISENFASLPVAVKRWTDRGAVRVKGHSVAQLLARPNAYMTGFMFRVVMATWEKDWGNAYAVIRRGADGRPVELHPAHPRTVQVAIVSGKKYYKVTFTDPDLAYLNGVYPDEDMIHVMEISLDGIVGINPILYNAGALDKAAAQEAFAADFYRKGGNIKAVMETEGNLGDDQYKQFMKHIQEAAQNFDTPLLEYGIKYKQLSVNPVAAQLLQSETLSIQDVCRILGIPPHMVAELSHATFSNIEHQTIQFVQYTLRPLVKRFEVELEDKLFFDSERDEYSIDFSLEGLLRGDTAARSAFYHNAILDGYLSRNEVRELEGYEHKDGLDDMLFPQNEGVVGQGSNDNSNE